MEGGEKGKRVGPGGISSTLLRREAIRVSCTSRPHRPPPATGRDAREATPANAPQTMAGLRFAWPVRCGLAGGGLEDQLGLGGAAAGRRGSHRIRSTTSNQAGDGSASANLMGGQPPGAQSPAAGTAQASPLGGNSSRNEAWRDATVCACT